MGLKKNRLISFGFSVAYALIVVVCSSVMWGDEFEVQLNSYGVKPSSESDVDSLRIIDYYTGLFMIDQKVFCDLAWFYFAYILMTFLYFDLCALHNALACSGSGSLNGYCRQDNFAIIFFGKIILNLILIFFTAIVFIESATIQNNMDKVDGDWSGSVDYDTKVFSPMLVSLLAFIVLPFDYYFGFTAIATE